MIFCLIEYHLCKQTNITRILGNFMKSHFLVAKNSITVSTLVFTKELQQCLGLIGMLFRSIEYHLCFCRQSFQHFCVTFQQIIFPKAKNSITVSTSVFTKELQQCLGLIGMLFCSIEYHLSFCRQSFRRFCVTLMSD